MVRDESGRGRARSKYRSWRLLFCGGAAGSIAKTCVSPLERVRIVAQTRPTRGGIGPLELFREILGNEGVRGFWKGNGVNVARVFPSRGILFWANAKLKDAFGRTSWGREHEGAVSFFSGSFAGLTAAVCTYPLDLMRTRITAPVGGRVTITSTLKKTVQKEGLWALYRGMGPTTAGALPYEGIKFGCYDALKRNLPVEWFPNPLVWQLVCGGIAGTTAGVAMYPNDTVRRLMQVQTQRGEQRQYHNMIDCYVRVWTDHGVARYYRGMSSYLLRAVPNASIQFAAFELIKSLVVPP